jgi:hypothetical protein
MWMTRSLACVTLAMAASGCVADDEAEPVAPATAALSFVESCEPGPGCGHNTPWLGTSIRFHELDAHGGFNDQGLELAGFKKGSRSLTLKVEGDQLLGVPAHGPALRGEQLCGAVIRLKGSGGESFFLHIVRTGQSTFWIDDPAQPGAQPSFERLAPVYHFLVARQELALGCDAPLPYEKPGVWNLCNDKASGDRLDEQDRPMVGKAVVFSGDRFTEQGNTVSPSDPTGWFNIACAGSAPWKMHLDRQTAAASGPPVYRTTTAQRNAYLKMLTGDYCGDGRLDFARPGWPLWMLFAAPFEPLVPDAGGGVMLIPRAEASSTDAIWSDAGAVCIDTPRLASVYAEQRARIEHECQRTFPACTPAALAAARASQHPPLAWSLNP